MLRIAPSRCRKAANPDAPRSARRNAPSRGGTASLPRHRRETLDTMQLRDVMDERSNGNTPVSYTHLTLPTKA